jgi:Rrf2 family iron-sulfur cluster assembly transcriptional regulator
VLSQTARYAVSAALHIAERGSEGPMLVRDMAEDLEVPRNYLSKILHRLAQAGLLTSTRGRGGGFKLGRPSDQVTLREVIECVEPNDGSESRCLLGRAVCSHVDPCAAHGKWGLIRDQLDGFFSETTLADLARDLGRASD